MKKRYLESKEEEEKNRDRRKKLLTKAARTGNMSAEEKKEPRRGTSLPKEPNLAGGNDWLRKHPISDEESFYLEKKGNSIPSALV